MKVRGREYDLEHSEIKYGYRLVVIRMTSHGLSHRCGYVGVPEKHPAHGQDYDHVDAEVHGGLTYGDSNKEYPIPDETNRWWFGFDCAHLGDDMPNGGQPLDYVIAECHKLADFLHSVEGAKP